MIMVPCRRVKEKKKEERGYVGVFVQMATKESIVRKRSHSFLLAQNVQLSSED